MKTFVKRKALSRIARTMFVGTVPLAGSGPVSRPDHPSPLFNTVRQAPVAIRGLSSE